MTERLLTPDDFRLLHTAMLHALTRESTAGSSPVSAPEEEADWVITDWREEQDDGGYLATRGDLPGC